MMIRRRPWITVVVVLVSVWLLLTVVGFFLYGYGRDEPLTPDQIYQP